MDLDLYALWIGRFVMLAAGGIVAVLLMVVVYWVAGLWVGVVLKRLGRVYQAATLKYWLQELERTGRYQLRRQVREHVEATSGDPASNQKRQEIR